MQNENRRLARQLAQARLDGAQADHAWETVEELIADADRAVFSLLTDTSGQVVKRRLLEQAALCESVSFYFTNLLTKEGERPGSYGQADRLVKFAEVIQKASINHARLLALASAVKVDSGAPLLSSDSAVTKPGDA